MTVSPCNSRDWSNTLSIVVSALMARMGQQEVTLSEQELTDADRLVSFEISAVDGCVRIRSAEVMAPITPEESP